MKLSGIQAARGVAAIAVVVAHTFPSFRVGVLGVDLFFVISGLVMVISSETLFGSNNAGLFIGRRIIRIVPLYWTTTTITAWFTPDLSYKNLIRSLLFIPTTNTLPVLSTGWTLNFEMYFYVLFAASLFLRKEAAVICVAFVISVPVLAGRIVPVSGPFAAYYCSPIALEFIAGMLIGLFINSIPYCAFLGIPAAAFIIAVTQPAQGEWCAIIAAALAVAGFTKVRAPRAMEFVGDISYSLYLVQGVLIGALTALSPLVVLTIVLAASAASYLLFERPVLSFLTQRLLRRRTSALRSETSAISAAISARIDTTSSSISLTAETRGIATLE